MTQLAHVQPYVMILEGADGAGKTYYAERILEQFGNAGFETIYIHNGPEDAKLRGSLYRHYLAQILDALDRPHTATVIDRSFLSEYVYGRLYRAKSRISLRQVRRLERFAKRKGVDLVGVTATLAERRQRLAERGEAWDRKQPFVGAWYAHHFFHVSKAWSTVER